MILTPQQQKYMPHIAFWAVMLALFWGAVILFQDVLLPFVLGLAVAYLLNPAVNKIAAMGCSRALAALLILGGFLLVFGLVIGGISPIVYHEFLDLYQDLPLYIEKFWSITAPITAMIEDHIGAADVQNIEALLKENSGSAAQVAQFILQKIGAGGQALVDLLSVAFFMPIVAYFMMKEWPRMTAWAQGLIPRPMEATVLDLLSQIDGKIAGFVRGQITVSVTLGLGYAVALSLVGLKYGFVIGLGAGLLSIIPMVGSVVGLLVGMAVAWFQTGSLFFVAVVAGVFALGQVIEGNFLTPKLVGESVGLHPLWVFFALLAGGSLLGLLGMFLAVPVAAVIGVLLGFGLRQYRASAYYDPSKAQ